MFVKKETNQWIRYIVLTIWKSKIRGETSLKKPKYDNNSFIKEYNSYFKIVALSGVDIPLEFIINNRPKLEIELL